MEHHGQGRESPHGFQCPEPLLFPAAWIGKGAEMNLDQVVATNVYLDDLSDMQAFDQVYAEYFGRILPARATIQQLAPTSRKPDKEDHSPDLEQVSLIAVRSPSAH